MNKEISLEPAARCYWLEATDPIIKALSDSAKDVERRINNSYAEAIKLYPKSDQDLRRSFKKATEKTLDVLEDLFKSCAKQRADLENFNRRTSDVFESFGINRKVFIEMSQKNLKNINETKNWLSDMIVISGSTPLLDDLEDLYP